MLPKVMYYLEMGGGLGDVLHSGYTRGIFNFIDSLTDGQELTLAIASHNPFIPELLFWHPKRDRVRLICPGYWDAPEDDFRRQQFSLPPYHKVRYQNPEPVARGYAGEKPKFYASGPDYASISWVVDGAPFPGKGSLIALCPSAGEPDRDIPMELCEAIIEELVRRKCRPVILGRSYNRNDRREIAPFLVAQSTYTYNLSDQLSIPGTVEMVRQCDGVICCHSAMAMLSWLERKPNAVIVSPETYFKEFGPAKKAMWGFGEDYPETDVIYENAGLSVEQCAVYIVTRLLRRIKAQKEGQDGKGE